MNSKENMNMLKILEETFFEVELCHDEEQKYRVICTMDLGYSFRDIITSKEIEIHEENPRSLSNRGLTCKNYVKQLSKPAASKILKAYSDKDIEDYHRYLTKIEEKSIRLYDQRNEELSKDKPKSKRRVKANSKVKKVRV